jgi:hypothetical protein
MATLQRCALSLLALLTVPLVPANMAGQEPPTPEQRPPNKYEVVAPGLIGNAPFTLQFRTADLRLVVRDLMMGRGEARDVPTAARAILELRGGSVITTINGEKKTRTQGDIWTVGKGDRLSLENPYDVAVIRAVYLFERGQ